MANAIKYTVRGRYEDVLAVDGADENSINGMVKQLAPQASVVEIIGTGQNYITREGGSDIPVKHSLLTAASVLYDSVYVPSGINSVATHADEPDAVHVIDAAYKHCKATAVHGTAEEVLESTYFWEKLSPSHS